MSQTGAERRCLLMFTYVVNFILSVGAGIVANGICKWLNGRRK